MKKQYLILILLFGSLGLKAQNTQTFPGIDTLKQTVMPALTDSGFYLITSKWFKQQPRVIPSDSNKYYYPFHTNPKNYLTGNQTITLTGDITGSGSTSIATTIANVNSFPGKYGSSNQVGAFQTNSKGQVIWDSLINIAFPVTSVFGRSGAVVLLSSDVTGALGYTPLSSSTGVTTFNGASGPITYNPTLQTITNNGNSTTNSISINALNTNNGTSNYHWAMYANGVPAFAGYLANTEGFNNVGADYAIQRYDSLGNPIDRPFSIRRATGSVTIMDTLNVTGQALFSGSITASALNAAGFVQTNGSGLFSTAALTSGQVTTALGYTPLSSANNGLSVSAGAAQLGGNLTVSTDINTTGSYRFTIDNAAPGTTGGFKVNLTNNASDGAWDMYVRDSVTGCMNRIPKGTWHQILQMGSSGPAWVNQPAAPNRAHTVFTPTNGATITLTNNGYNIINPSGTLASLVMNLPASPADGDIIELKFVQTVSSVTFSGGTMALAQNTSSGSYDKIVFDASTSKWY